MTTLPWLWIVFTLLAAAGQTARNAMQKELIATLGTVGATHVRFLFGLPFALLFLAGVLLATGHAIPRFDGTVVAWALLGAITQITATALMLAAMKERSFVLTTALIKIEPVWVALFGLVFLGDQLTWPLAGAIAVATVGVLAMSWPRRVAGGVGTGLSWRPIAYGIAAGMVFGISAVGYRGAILEVRRLGGDNFVVSATSVLVLGLLIQVALLTAWLVLRDRATLAAIVRAWRPSVMAGFMGAFASQCWFLAFAVESAARVRTLALVEILFAQVVSRSLFKQGLSGREGVGLLLVVAGVAWLLTGS